MYELAIKKYNFMMNLEYTKIHLQTLPLSIQTNINNSTVNSSPVQQSCEFVLRK